RNLLALVKSSVRNQPPMFTLVVVGFHNSTASTWGKAVWLNTSVMRMGAKAGSAGSVGWPGVPPKVPLERQLAFKPQVSHGAFSSTITREKPWPSVIGYQELL